MTEAALQATLAMLARFESGERTPPAGPSPTMRWQPAMRQADRAIDWECDDTATVMARLRCADGQPGVLDALWGQPCYLYDAHEASAATMEAFTLKTAVDPVSSPFFSMLALGWVGLAYSPDG